MKIEILDAHDRLLHFNKQADYISQGCRDCINNRPQEFGNYPFYIWAHTRTEDNGSDKRLIWQPRLTKPKAQTNSMLFKAYPPGESIKICWMIPDRLLWNQYQKGNLTENKLIMNSIFAFENKRIQLEASEDDDLPYHIVDAIYNEIKNNAINRKMMDRLYQDIPTYSENRI